MYVSPHILTRYTPPITELNMLSAFSLKYNNASFDYENFKHGLYSRVLKFVLKTVNEYLINEFLSR